MLAVVQQGYALLDYSTYTGESIFTITVLLMPSPEHTVSALPDLQVLGCRALAIWRGSLDCRHIDQGGVGLHRGLRC